MICTRDIYALTPLEEVYFSVPQYIVIGFLAVFWTCYCGENINYSLHAISRDHLFTTCADCGRDWKIDAKTMRVERVIRDHRALHELK